MSNAEHSPLPWSVLAPYHIEAKDGDILATTSYHTDDTGRANADFIVEACNNYARVCKERDELLDALKDALPLVQYVSSADVPYGLRHDATLAEYKIEDLIEKIKGGVK